MSDEMKGSDSWDDTREAMWLASKNKVFYKTNVIIKEETEIIKPSVEEFRLLLIKHSPNCLMLPEYSRKEPFIHITKMINPSHEGVEFYTAASVDKEPEFKSFEDFYRFLELNGGIASYKF